jgi:peptidyl-prolyl cis-trans isomerase D
MFQKLFKLTGKALIYIMFLLLIASFGVWGVGDVLQGGFNDTIAEVNGVKISKRNIESMVSQRKSEILRSSGQTELPEEFNNILESSVLRQSINQVLFEAEVNKMGILLDGKQVFKTEMANQKDITKEKFQNFLRSIGKTETRYISELGQQKSIDYIEAAIAANPPVSEYMVQQANAYQNEKRSYEFFEIPASLIKMPDTPTNADLDSFYADKKAQFALPEQRTAKVLVIDKSALSQASVKEQSNIEKVDSHVSEVGDLGDSSTEETQNISEELYSIANTALDKIAEGKTLEDVASELKLKLVDIKNIDSTGKISPENEVELPDVKDLLKNIFNAEQGKTSELLEDQKGQVFALLRVDAISPARERTIDEAKAEVTSAWQFENMNNKYEKTANEIAEKAAKNGFEKVAAENNFTIKKSESLNRNATNVANGLLEEIFTTDDKTKVTNAYRSNNGTFVVARLSEIIPAKVDELELYGVKSTLQEQLKEDLMSQYMVYLASKYKVKIYK